MAALRHDEIEDLLTPYVSSCSPELIAQLARYLELLLRWNARTNLTAIRDPRQIVTRHFGESLFAAERLGEMETLLDYGSGAGFPGLPIALARSGIRVTLAESQSKKVAFLREVVRSLGVAVEVWPGRVAAMPVGRSFDVVALRAVDSMEQAVVEASRRAAKQVVLLTTTAALAGVAPLRGFGLREPVAIPNSGDGVVAMFVRE